VFGVIGAEIMSDLPTPELNDIMRTIRRVDCRPTVLNVVRQVAAHERQCHDRFPPTCSVGYIAILAT